MASIGRPAADCSSAATGGGGAAGAFGGLSAAALLIFSSLALTSGASAATAEDLKRGEDLLIRHCARCHAVGRTGDSARPDAPAFRVLGKRYPIDSLEESLGEGIMSGHPDMPDISFEGEDVGAIVDYLKSIQMR